MKKYNLAIVGTFDYENFGDLMFPIVFKEQIKKRIDIDNLFLFSPNSCDMPLNPQKTKVYSIDQIEQIHTTYGLDAIIFGGGDLARFDDGFAPSDNYIPDNSSFDLMVYSTLIANKYNIPILWNCPGVPFEFSPSEAKIVKLLMDEFIGYISARDAKSAQMLEKCGSKNKVTVSPDTVLSVSTLIDKNENGIFDLLCDEFSFLKGEYVVFQSAKNDSKDFKKTITEQLNEISERTNKKVVFLPIGNVHFDDKYIEELLRDYPSDNFVSFNRKLNIFETNAVLANSVAFIGTSLHGNIVSNSYGVPSIGLNYMNLVKLKNFFILLDRKEYCIGNMSELSSVFSKMLGEKTLEKLPSAIESITSHFDKIAKLTEEQTTLNGSTKDLLKLCFTHTEQRSGSIAVYFDLGNGFNESYKETYQIFGNCNDISLKLDIPKSTKAIRIDPCEGCCCAFYDLEISSNSRPLKYTSNCFLSDSKDIDLLFYNDDPQIIVNVDSDISWIEITGFLIIANKNTDLDKFLYLSKPRLEAIKETIDKLQIELSNANKELKDAVNTIDSISAENAQINQNYQNLLANHNELLNSFFWRLTAVPRKIVQKFKDSLKNHPQLLEVFIYCKGFLRGGFKGGKERVKSYRRVNGRMSCSNVWEITKKERKEQQKFKFQKDIKFSILVPLYNTTKGFSQADDRFC